MDERDYKREKRKRILRQNVIQVLPKDEEVASEENKILRVRKIRKMLIGTGVVTAILFCIFFAWNYYRKNHQFKGYEIGWEKAMPEGSFSGYQIFGDNVVRYTKEGASYLNSSGEEVWNQSYEIKNPIAVTNGFYIAIADQKGNNGIIANKEGVTGRFKTNKPITKLTVSANGGIIVNSEDSVASYWDFYTKDGTKLENEAKFLLSSKGYPLDLSASPSGLQVISSIVSLKGNTIENDVVFWNYSDKGKSLKNNLVAGFSYEESVLIPKVHFFSENYACAIGTNKLTFYSLKNELIPSKVGNADIEIKGEVEAVFYNNSYMGYIVKEVENLHILFVYSQNGTKILEQNIGFDFAQVDIGKEYIILSNSSECVVLSMLGVEKFRGNFDFEIIKVVEQKRTDRLIAMGTSEMKEIILK